MTTLRALSGSLTQVAPKSDWQDTFIEALASAPSVKAACDAAGIARQTAYLHRTNDPEFAARWEDAIEAAIDMLEKAAYERATTISDTLAIFLLKAHRPKLYRETTRTEITGAGGGPVLLAAVAADRDRLAASLVEESDAGAAYADDRRAIAGDADSPEPIPGA